MELNPNHPVTASLREEWYKIAALLMIQFGQAHVEITIEEIERLAANPSAIAVQMKTGRIILDLVSMAEAERLAKQAG